MSNNTFKRPIVLTKEQLEEIRIHKDPKIVDIYNQQLRELQKINNPSGKTESSTREDQATDAVWIYYPWRNTLLHTVGEEALFLLRTNRNRELITIKEQKELASAVVGIAGMSVGSGIALALNYSGIAQTIKIADFDDLDTSNLNRLRESLLDVGRPKTILAAERIYELNPYANVDMYSEGLNASNIEAFFKQPKLSIVIDEIDDFTMKIQLRLHARKNKIPLLMFTSLGDNILVDVERYDIEPNLAIFNGLVKDVKDEILANPNISSADIRKYSISLVGQQYIPTKAIKSVFEMGKTLVGRPQLYSTIAVDGGLAAYVTRQIILNNVPKSGRYFVKFANFFDIDSNDFSETAERNDLLSQLRG